MAKYKPELGIFGNITELFRNHNENRDNIQINKIQAENDMLSILASDVEAVEDEFNAITEEE